MSDPITTTVGLGAIAAYLGKDGLSKLLGPTAEYLGGELVEFTRKRVDNVGRILRSAHHKLGNEIEKPGIVPPKVLKTIINDGSYNEDELTIEYFGGILASSRTQIGRDDRGARIAKILDSMSAYQIRSHYFVYSLIKKTFSSSGYKFNMDDRPKMELFIPMKNYLTSMDFSEEEMSQFNSIINHAFFGLSNDDLIQTFQYGPKEQMQTKFPEAKTDGILVSPSAFGAELYLWGYGKGNQELSYTLKAKELPDLPDFSLSLDGVSPLKK